MRFAPKIRNSAWRSLGLGGLSTALAVVVGAALLVAIPAPVGHGAPATPLAITTTAVPAGSSIDSYNAAIQNAFAQVQAAVAASANLKAVPSNLQPPVADAAAEHKAMLFERLPAKLFRNRPARVRLG